MKFWKVRCISILAVATIACEGGSVGPDLDLGSCGDGVVDVLELCDDGPNNSDVAPDACRASTCRPAACGDAVVDAGETCDDGNALGDDFCNASCTGPGLVAHVYVLSGQSNMVGQGVWSSEAAQHLVPEVHILSATHPFKQDYQWVWSELYPAGKLQTGSTQYFGPEIGFAEAMSAAHPGEKIVLIKYALGALDLDFDFFPAETRSSSKKGYRYRQLMETIELGLSQIATPIAEGGLGMTPRIEGFLWMQGENDAIEPAPAARYRANLDRFIRRVREDLETPELPFVVGQIHMPNYERRETIRRAQSLVGEMVPGVVVIPTHDLSLRYDEVHYDSEGQLELGDRFARALLDLEPPVFPEPSVGPEAELAFLVDRVPESDQYELLYALDVPESSNFTSWQDVEAELYVNRADELAGVDFDRVAYLLVLENAARGRHFAWASMAHACNDLREIFVPAGLAWQLEPTHLNVFSNTRETVTAAAGWSHFPDGYGAARASVELCSSDYAAGLDDSFDDHDEGCSERAGHGAMQIHRDGQTILSYGGWGTGGSCDLGIATNPVGMSTEPTTPDWTFSESCGEYSYKRLYAFIKPTTVPPIPEAEGYTLVQSLDIPVEADWTSAEDVSYAIDYTADLADLPFDRIGYHLEISGPQGTQSVWVSMRAFTSEVREIGVPAGDRHFWTEVDDVDVVSNVEGLDRVVASGEGRIEFWRYDALPGGDGDYDGYDVPIVSDVSRYGSMQVHVGDRTVFAINRWTGGWANLELGIGDSPASACVSPDTQSSDWTGAQNAADFVKRRLTIFVRPTR